MKKLLRSRIFAFILGAIMFSCISVYATIKIQASEIGYIDKNNNEITVEAALNSLYTLAEAKQIIFGTPIYKNIRSTSSTTAKTLSFSDVTKGNYIVVVSENYAWTSTTAYDNAIDTASSISCSNNNCTSSSLLGKELHKSGTVKKDDYYVNEKNKLYIYRLETKDTTNVSIQYVNSLDGTKYPSSVHAVLVPIS